MTKNKPASAKTTKKVAAKKTPAPKPKASTPKPAVPTPEDVSAEIEKLRSMKNSVRHFTAFNDDNHAAIETQIEVLEKDLTTDAIHSRWDVDYLREAARDARDWKDGRLAAGDTLSGAWAELVVE